MLKKICSNNNWKEVKQSALTTIGKELKKEPTPEWKFKILLAEHSPIRKLRIAWCWQGIKSWIATHFVRHHVGIEHFIQTQRSDRTNVNRDKSKQSELVNHSCDANAQAIINISRKRLCFMAHKETRKVWIDFKKSIKKIEPELYQVMVPECIYRGECPEFEPCGFFKKFKEKCKIHGIQYVNIEGRYRYYHSLFFEKE